MLAEILTAINTGVGIVEGITRVLKNMHEIGGPNSNKELEASIGAIQQRVAAVEDEIHKPKADDVKITAAYSDLVKALQQDKNYASRLEIIPTDHGTWKIVRKTGRKKTVLRDPQGEY